MKRQPGDQQTTGATGALASASLPGREQSLPLLGGREIVARIVDPKAWGLEPGISPTYMGSKDRQQFALAKADAILSALGLGNSAQAVQEPLPGHSLHPDTPSEPSGLYQERPVEAFCWTGQDRNDWPGWAAESDSIDERCDLLLSAAVTGLYVWTPEGQMRAFPGDWIIRGVTGLVRPCKPDTFAATYAAFAAASSEPQTGAVSGRQTSVETANQALSQPPQPSPEVMK